MTKQNYFIKLFLCMVLFLMPFLSFSQQIMPMPVYVPSDGGSITAKQAIALLIALNIPMVLFFVVRSLIWIFKTYKDYSLKEYVVWSDFDLFSVECNTICFIVINATALIIFLTDFISNLI
jgi:hypothetical protein